MDEKQTTLRIPKDLYAALNKIAEESGLNISGVIKLILYCSYLKRQ